MTVLTLRETAIRFWTSLDGLNAIYNNYARSAGLSYSSLYVLDIVFSARQGCTQKIICRQTLLPKQTVNAIIKVFINKGIAEFNENGADRREKIIRLTNRGEAFAGKIIGRMREAECRALAKMSRGQRNALLMEIDRFKDLIGACMRKER